MSSCSRNRSPSDDCTVCDVSSVPPGASTSWATARSCSPERSRVPITTRSTSTSAARALRSGRLPGEARGGGAGAHDQRADARQRRRDRVRQAEGQEVRLGVGAEDAERQHHEARERAGQGRRVVARGAADDAQLLGHDVGRFRPLRGTFGQRPADHAVRRRHRRGAGERRGLFVQGGVQDLDDVLAAERRTAGEHLEQDGARREQVGAGDPRPPPSPARGPCSAGCPPSCPCASGPRRCRASPRGAGLLGRARPKSSSFTPCGVRNTLDGLRSRWTMPRACSADNAASIPRPMGIVSATLSGPRRRRSASASPSSSSMAMNSSPPSSPIS